MEAVTEFEIYDFEDLDLRPLDGEEPAVAELVLAEEERAVMELNNSQDTVIGGIEEDDLLQLEPASGFEHKSAEDSVGMYLREIGRVSLLSASDEIALAISMQKGKRAMQRLEEIEDLSPEERHRMRMDYARGNQARRSGGERRSGEGQARSSSSAGSPPSSAPPARTSSRVYSKW